MDANNSSKQVSFETYANGIKEPLRSLIIELREYVNGLGNNVIEDLRPHRIVYAKTLTFRTFLDIKPRIDYLEIKLTNGRFGSTTDLVKDRQELSAIKDKVSLVYNNL